MYETFFRVAWQCRPFFSPVCQIITYICASMSCACLFYSFFLQCLTIVKPGIFFPLPHNYFICVLFQLNPSKRKVFWAPCRPRLARALLCRVQPRPTSAWRTSADWEVISLTSAIFWAFVLVCVYSGTEAGCVRKLSGLSRTKLTRATGPWSCKQVHHGELPALFHYL